MDKHDLARKDFLDAIRIDPKDDESYEGLALLEASSNDPKFLDAKSALQHAKRACELTEWNDTLPLAALAAAHARAGNFPEALRWQQKAVEKSTDDCRAEMLSRLALFKSGKAYERPKAAMKQAQRVVP